MRFTLAAFWPVLPAIVGLGLVFIMVGVGVWRWSRIRQK